MNAFVSGGAGFIGSHLVRQLLTDNDISNVMVFDNFSSGRQSFLPDGDQSRLRVVRDDLKKLEAVKDAMDGCDTVFLFRPIPISRKRQLSGYHFLGRHLLDTKCSRGDAR